jgi:hypothetical protein
MRSSSSGCWGMVGSGSSTVKLVPQNFECNWTKGSSFSLSRDHCGRWAAAWTTEAKSKSVLRRHDSMKQAVGVASRVRPPSDPWVFSDFYAIRRGMKKDCKGCGVSCIRCEHLKYNSTRSKIFYQNIVKRGTKEKRSKLGTDRQREEEERTAGAYQRWAWPRFVCINQFGCRVVRWPGQPIPKDRVVLNRDLMK